MDTFVAKLAKFVSLNMANLATFEYVNSTILAILKQETVNASLRQFELRAKVVICIANYCIKSLLFLL